MVYNRIDSREEEKTICSVEAELWATEIGAAYREILARKGDGTEALVHKLVSAVLLSTWYRIIAVMTAVCR